MVMNDPWDWKTLIKSVLSTAQYSLWIQEWQDELYATAMQNINHNIPIDIDMLLGEEAYNTLQAQVELNRQTFPQIVQAAIKAWMKLPENKSPGSFSTIYQKAGEPYIDFVNRFQEAMMRQVGKKQAVDVLTLQLVYENANKDCKKVFALWHAQRTNTPEMVKAFQTVGTEAYKAQVLVAVLRPQACFKRGKGGHFAKQCRNKDSQNN